MEGLDFADLQGNNVNDFVKAYRDALRSDYTATINQIEQQRRNDEASIMSNANRLGMMYSNFPERDKMKYEAETYLPNRQKAFKTYQTGLDKLRANAVNAYNNIRSIEDAIADLNSSGGGGGGRTGGGGGDDGVQYWGEARAQDGGTWFYDNNGNPVRFSTWAINNGAKSSSDLLKYAQQALKPDEYNRLKKIYDAQQSTKHPNFTRNTGKNYTENNYSYLSPEDNSFLNNLGLGF